MDNLIVPWPSKGEITEESWVTEYMNHEADVEFRRSRRRALGRRFARALLGWLHLSPEVEPPRRATDGVSLLLPVDSIVGLASRNGRKNRRLPRMHRRWAAEWRRLYCGDVIETYTAVSVRAGADGWYLAGGAESLLILELVRAKGGKHVRVVELRMIETVCCRASNAVESSFLEETHHRCTFT